ncbi:MAG: hypothetical protein ACK4ND_14220 [Cytophagaceae bacterium]
MNFQEYCKSKKIDVVAFQKGSPEQFREWRQLFDQVHPDSFTEQKKFLINAVRRKYLFREEEKLDQPVERKTVKPVIKPKK